MSAVEFLLSLTAVSLLAGFVGSMAGLGGGIIVVPALTLLYGVDIHYAIGASIISVVATSSGAGAAYVRQRLVNTRLAMLLEVATSLGAVTGAVVSAFVAPRLLFLIFGIVLILTAIAMHYEDEPSPAETHTDPLAKRLQLNTSYFNNATGNCVSYKVMRVKLGLALMSISGVISGLLGIGSGALNVPAMNLAMRLPLKVCTATSNFVMGITAAASASIYFARGDIDPVIAAPVALGVTAGSLTGARVMSRTHNYVLRWIFVITLVIIAIQMMWKGLQ